jgi:hypothetical protein
MKAAGDGINRKVKPSGTGCVECIGLGKWWFHLRRCAECGHIGCATAHQTSTHRSTTPLQDIWSSRVSNRANTGFMIIAREKRSKDQSFPLPTAIPRTSRYPARPERFPPTGNPNCTNRPIKLLREDPLIIGLSNRQSSRR